MNTEELEQRLTAYLELRRALGAEVGEGAKVLENFIIFAGRQSNIVCFRRACVGCLIA